jgi:hypothetical protein
VEEALDLLTPGKELVGDFTIDNVKVHGDRSTLLLEKGAGDHLSVSKTSKKA